MSKKDKRALIEQIKNYKPWNEQEEKDRKLFLQELNGTADIFHRENELAHMTASAWVINPGADKVLMVYHNIYDSWSWLGGHADGEEDLLKVAMKEVREESGIQTLRPVSEDIYSLEILTVDGHWKKGSYVPCHLHFNITYLIEAEEDQDLRIKEDENQDVAWFTLEEALQASSEPWFVEHIYSKLNKKLS